MNRHALAVLEYEKVKSVVAEYAASEPGKVKLSLLYPASDLTTVETLLAETREFTRLLERGETPPLDPIHDIRQTVTKLRAKGGVLSPAELLAAAATLGTGRRVRKFFDRRDSRRAPSPLLSGIADRIRPLKDAEDAVFGAIDDNGEVKDSASPGLRRTRKLIARMRDDVLTRMGRILQDGGYQKVIQEPVITVRDDRYVLPLKPNFRQRLRGVVHGHSGSRATLFVEPLEIVEQNNRLAEIRMEEREEVERVLRELTAFLSRDLDVVQATVTALTELDAISARARFGLEYRAVVPELSGGRRICLRGAKHPLLVVKSRASGAETVPNDIVLDDEQRAVILSGPNAGGKTVVLKTVGLLCLMAQSGLPVTAAEGTELPCFGSVFADIGDEQSLERDLSSFSSHAGRIAEILREARADSLVLLDELGTGTDPGEGAGLGAAVLESLIGRGCVTLVTTHHNALKLFGLEMGGAMNASMEFDAQTLKPTYRFLLGRPGRSYGLDMASRTGIPEDVIARARDRMRDDDKSLERLLSQVEEDSRQLASARESAEQELKAAKQYRTQAEAELREACAHGREQRAKARAETTEIVAALRRKLRELSRSAALDRAEVRRAGDEVDALISRLKPHDASGRAAAPPSPVKPGDRVRVPGLKTTGLVLASSRNVLDLEVGGKKVRISAAEAVPAEPETPSRQAFTAGWSADVSEDGSTADRLNIVGLRAAEAVAELERFIDRASLNNLHIVTIIHGLGTGTLRAAVSESLQKHPLVETFRAGGAAEGGAGVTIAELKR